MGGRPLQIAETDAGMQRDVVTLAFLETERALDVNELFDDQRRLVHPHADLAAAVGQHDRIAAGCHFQAAGAEAGDEIDIGPDLRAGPGGALVGFQVHAQGFQRQEVDTGERHLIGAGRQRPQIADDLGRILEEGEPQIQVLHHQTDCIGVALVIAVDVTVAVTVDEIGTGADEHIHVGQPEAEAVHRDVVETAVITIVGGHQRTGAGRGGLCRAGEAGDHVDADAAALLQREAAADEEEVVDLQQGMTDVDAEHGTVEIDVDRRAAGGDVVAGRAEAGGEVDVGAQLQARPLAALVHAHGDVGDIQLHEAPVDVDQRTRQRRLQRVHRGDDALGVHRLGRAQDGEADVDVLQHEQRVIDIADGDAHVGGAEAEAVHRQILEPAVVGRQQAIELELLDVGGDAGGLRRQRTGQPGDDVDPHAGGLLEGEVALDLEEVADVEQGVGEADADHAALVGETHGRAADGGHTEAVGTEAGDEIDIGAAELTALPVAPQIGIHRQLAHLELEEVPIDTDRIVPLHLDGVQLGHDAIRVGRPCRGHHDQAEIDVVQRDAERIGIAHLAEIRVEQAVAVGVDEVRAETDEHVDVAGGQQQRVDCQIVDAAVVGGQAGHLVQTGLQAGQTGGAARRQAGDDIDLATGGLLEVDAAADVDVIGDGQRGAADGDRGQTAALPVHVQRDAGATGAGGHMQGVGTGEINDF